MFKTDEEITKILTHKNNNTILHKTIGSGNHGNGGNKNGTAWKPLLPEEKAEAVIFSHFFGVKAAGELVGKPHSEISRFKDQRLVKMELKDRISGIQEKVLDKVDCFLEMVSAEKDLSDSLKAATVAEKVVNIYERLSPKVPPTGPMTQQIIFYAPKLRPQEDYPVIEMEGS
jgi:hypothetical protein